MKKSKKNNWLIPVIITCSVIILLLIYLFAFPHYKCENGKCLWKFIGDQYKKDCDQNCNNLNQKNTDIKLSKSGVTIESNNNLLNDIKNETDHIKRKSYVKNLKNNGPFYCISHQTNYTNYVSCVPSQLGNESKGQNPNKYYDIWGFPVNIVSHLNQNNGLFYQVINGKVTNNILNPGSLNERIFYTSEFACQEAINRGDCQSQFIDPWQYSFLSDIYPFEKHSCNRRRGCNYKRNNRNRRKHANNKDNSNNHKFVKIQEPVQREPIQQEPVPVQQESEPVSVQQEPVPVQQEPVSVQQEPVLIQQESEPVLIQQESEPVSVQQESEPVSVQQEPVN